MEKLARNEAIVGSPHLDLESPRAGVDCTRRESGNGEPTDRTAELSGQHAVANCFARNEKVDPGPRYPGMGGAIHSGFGVKEAPLTAEVAREVRSTILEHRDPGDRFLVATAKAYDLTLVTADARLFRLDEVALFPNPQS